MITVGSVPYDIVMEQNGGGGHAQTFFSSKSYSANDLQELSRQGTLGHASGLSIDTGVAGGLVGGQSLSEIVNENNEELFRRRSLHSQFDNTAHSANEENRRLSMMEFGSPVNSPLDGFPFNPAPARNAPTALPNGGGIAKRRMNSKMALSRRSQHATPIETSVQEFPMGPDSATQSPLYQQQQRDADAMNLDFAGPGPYEAEFDANISYGVPMDPNMAGEISMFPEGIYSPEMTTSLQAQLPASMQGQYVEGSSAMGGEGLQNIAENALPSQMNGMGSMGGSSNSQDISQTHTNSSNSTSQAPQGLPDNGMMQGISTSSPTVDYGLPSTLASAGLNVQKFTTSAGMKTIPAVPPVPHYPNAYSQSGFDMLGMLMRVSTRRNAQINIGAVDLSCAFVVCDVKQHDVPIVYCSDMFERLTGYVRHEILGRNCRFLQSPDGKVQPGIKRKYVDDQSVWHLKNMTVQRKEAQISLINYRKGGQPFMNLLTMIPIPWDTDEIRYFVGFQVDLVEQPTSITNKNPDGSYTINYQRGLLPPYMPQNASEKNIKEDSSQVTEKDEVSSVLGTINASNSDYSKRICDKVMIENTDDVVHVLSLKGMFQYLSPAAKTVLEYEPHELVGTPLSSICHPSDIVPVTRELKDTTPGTTVNVVFRIRRKYSGYTWFESHGSLHTEQGKGKKCIILTGRERPVYALQRHDIISTNDIGDNELWTKMSTSGMFLFVSTHSKSLLDRQPEDLVGSSAQALMRPESKEIMNRVLEFARAGQIRTFKHDIQNRRGQTLHAQTTLYPGDASEGHKPTFLIAQTKLLKMSRERANAAGFPMNQPSPDSDRHDTATDNAVNFFSTGSGSSQRAPSMNSSTGFGNEAPDGAVTSAGGHGFSIGSQSEMLASEDNVFDELKTTRSTSWQFELRQMEKRNRVLAEELQSLNSSKKKRKRRKGLGQLQKDCVNCHTRNTPEWRRGPSGERDLCNSCGLRWAKQNGRVSPRTCSSQQGDKSSNSPSSVGVVLEKPRVSAAAKEKRAADEEKTSSHNAKMSKMESKAVEGYYGGVPSKIEEGVEPIEGTRLIDE